jgi:small basic protein
MLPSLILGILHLLHRSNDFPSQLEPYINFTIRLASPQVVGANFVPLWNQQPSQRFVSAIHANNVRYRMAIATINVSQLQ